MAWSGADAPVSWTLTAALFATLRDDPQLLALAARIDADRLPALLFVAAVMALVERERPHPLSRLCRSRATGNPRFRRTSPPSFAPSAFATARTCLRWPRPAATR